MVWQVWSQPEHIAQWWGPPGMKTTVVEHNFTVGGHWEYTMIMPDGNPFISEGTYSAIVEPERIETSANFRPMTEGVEMHMTFEDAGEETHFTFKVIHVTEEYCRQQLEMGFHQGWGSTFDRLQAYLEKA